MNKLRIHYLQHVPFEDLGCIEEWAFKQEHTLSSTKFYENENLPDPSSFDWLIIMGGPMGVYEEDKYPWLKTELEFIKNAIGKDKTIIGICLGAQLIASALGAKVYPNKEKEIGWFPIQISEDLSIHNPLLNWENNFPIFHWHGDTFDLPPNATLLASSAACLNQAFIYNEKVIGLQFHFEVTEKSLAQMIEFGKKELIQEKYIQNEQLIINGKSLIQENHQRMYQLLNYLGSK